MYNNDWNSQFSIQRSVKSNTHCTYKEDHFHRFFLFPPQYYYLWAVFFLCWSDLFVYLFINLLYTNINLLWFCLGDILTKFSANFHFYFFILPPYRHFSPHLIYCCLQKQTLKYLPIFGCKIDFFTCQMIIVSTVILCCVLITWLFVWFFFH